MDRTSPWRDYMWEFLGALIFWVSFRIADVGLRLVLTRLTANETALVLLGWTSWVLRTLSFVVLLTIIAAASIKLLKQLRQPTRRWQ